LKESLEEISGTDESKFDILPLSTIFLLYFGTVKKLLALRQRFYLYNIF